MRIKIDFFIYNIFRAIFGFIEDVSNVLYEYSDAIKMESVPNDMANFNGFLEKPKIPAEANENIFRMEYFVLPAARSLRV